MTERLALVYVRQSRHKADERTASPEVQEAECRRLPAVAGCERVEVFSDLDVSGGKLAGRRELARLLSRLEAGGVDVVAAYDQSRAFRNTRDALEFYARMEKRAEVEVVFVHGRFDRSPAGEFTYTAMAAAHAMERRMTAEKVRAAYAYRNARGETTGMPPYGYTRERGAGHMTIDEPAAEVIRRIFTDYVTGRVSARAIAGRLNDEGVARARARSKLGWLPDTVIDVLRNVAYTGRTYSVSRGRREGEIIAGSWPAIIDAATFARAQELLGERSIARRAGVGRDYAFARLLVCARCGAPMRVTVGKGGVYYACRRDVGDPCPAPSVAELRLLAWAGALFERLEALQPADFADAVARAGERRKSPAAASEAVSAALERLAKLFAWGHMEEDAYTTERSRLEALRAELVAQGAAPAPPVALAGVGGLWRHGSAAERRELLGTLFERLYVVDGDIVRYVARLEHRDEIEELVTEAIGPALEFEYASPKIGRPKRVAVRGEGGIALLIRTPLEAVGG